jgi:hypothetical protein
MYVMHVELIGTPKPEDEAAMPRNKSTQKAARHLVDTDKIAPCFSTLLTPV